MQLYTTFDTTNNLLFSSIILGKMIKNVMLCWSLTWLLKFGSPVIFPFIFLCPIFCKMFLLHTSDWNFCSCFKSNSWKWERRYLWMVLRKGQMIYKLLLWDRMWTMICFSISKLRKPWRGCLIGIWLENLTIFFIWKEKSSSLLLMYWYN